MLGAGIGQPTARGGVGGPALRQHGNASPGGASLSLSRAGTCLRGPSGCFSLLASCWPRPGPPPSPEQLLGSRERLPPAPAFSQCGHGRAGTPDVLDVLVGPWERRGKPSPSPSARSTPPAEAVMRSNVLQTTWQVSPDPPGPFPNAPAQFVLCVTSLSKVSKFGHEDAPKRHKLGRVSGKQWVSQGSENQCDQVRRFPEPVREGRGPRGAEALLDRGFGRRRQLSPCSVQWHALQGFGGQTWSGDQRTGGRPTGENCLPCYGSHLLLLAADGRPHVCLRGGA